MTDYDGLVYGLDETMAGSVKVRESDLPCTVEGCGSPRFARGLCPRHRRHAIQGKELSAKKLIYSRFSEADFWARVDKSDGCWEWKAALTLAGYGKVQLPSGKTGAAHRLAYERVNGPIPEGLVIDHLCRNKKCVRPDHLEAVTVKENTVRGASSLDFSGRCLSGKHVLESDSDIVQLTRGKRTCAKCKHEGERARREVLNRAAEKLGMSRNQYQKKYGMAQKVALSIIEGASHA